MSTETYEEFMRRYAGNRKVIEVEVPARDTPADSPFIVVRHDRFAAVVNPLGMHGYLDIDIHPFVAGQDAAASVMGLTQGRRVPGFREIDTPLRSHGWPAMRMVAVFVGD